MTTKEIVMQYLSASKVSRQELVAKTNLSDRAVRRAISELRNDGVPVCTDSQDGGYWIGNDTDKERTIKEIRGRAFKLLTTANRMEKYYDGEQMELGG